MDIDTKYPIADMKADAADAFNKAGPYHTELKEIYKYYMPWRIPTSDRAGSTGGKTEGASLGMEHLFDSTALSSAAAFVANMQADWMPHFEPIFKIEAGPLFDGSAEEKARFNLGAEAAGDIVHGLLPKTRVQCLEVFQDLFAGTGALLMEKGKRERDPIRSVAVPPLELAMSAGPWGEIERWFWRRSYKSRHLPELWPDAKFSDRMNKQIKDNRDSLVEVIQYTYWCDREDRFRLAVWTNVDETLLRTDDYKTSPWITPRGFVVPGEGHGRGLAHLGLPSAKTLNKARELALRAAAFALLGLWIRRHDGVFNPDTAVMKPGAMWKVAQTGGPMKSIDRLDVPNNFDISHVVMNDEREQFRRVLLDDEMPELADRVRSPTEIAGRMRRYDRNRGGNTIRLAQELIVPLARRSIDIVEQHGFLPTSFRIDQMSTQATVLAPAAINARSAKVERFTSWMQIVMGLFGPEAAMMIAKIEEAIPQLARWLGVEEKFLRTKAETGELKDLVAKYLAQLAESKQAKAVQAKAQVVPEAAASQAYMNGAM